MREEYCAKRQIIPIELFAHRGRGHTRLRATRYPTLRRIASRQTKDNRRRGDSGVNQTDSGEETRGGDPLEMSNDGRGAFKPLFNEHATPFAGFLRLYATADSIFESLVDCVSVFLPQDTRGTELQGEAVWDQTCGMEEECSKGLTAPD